MLSRSEKLYPRQFILTFEEYFCQLTSTVQKQKENLFSLHFFFFFF